MWHSRVGLAALLALLTSVAAAAEPTLLGRVGHFLTRPIRSRIGAGPIVRATGEPDGPPLGYRMFGHGDKVIVMCPGSFFNHNQMTVLAQRLIRKHGKDHRVLIFDLPGIGWSSGLPKPEISPDGGVGGADHGVAYLAQQTGRLLDHLGIKAEQTTLFGHSLGSDVALYLALTRKGHRKVVLSGVPYVSPATGPGIQKQFEQKTKDFRHLFEMQEQTIDNDNLGTVVEAFTTGGRKLSTVSRKERLHARMFAKVTGWMLKGSKVWALSALVEQFANPRVLEKVGTDFERLLSNVSPDLQVTIVAGKKDTTMPLQVQRQLHQRLPPENRKLKIVNSDHVRPMLVPHAANPIADSIITGGPRKGQRVSMRQRLRGWLGKRVLAHPTSVR